MNVQQIARANTTWMDSPTAGTVASLLVVASLLCMIVLISLISAVATGVSVVIR